MIETYVTSRQISEEMFAIIRRNNEKVKQLQALPSEIRNHMDTQVFTDIKFLVNYINALHQILDDISKEKEDADKEDEGGMVLGVEGSIQDPKEG